MYVMYVCVYVRLLFMLCMYISVVYLCFVMYEGEGAYVCMKCYVCMLCYECVLCCACYVCQYVCMI